MYKCILYETNSRVRSMQTGINDDDDKSKKGIQDEPRGKLVDYHNPNVASKVIPRLVKIILMIKIPTQM